MPVGTDPPDLKRIVLLAIGVPVLLGLLVAWFGWTARETKVPHGLPIVVVDQEVPGGAIQPREWVDDLTGFLPGQYNFRMVPSIDAGDQALRDRTAYAAVVVMDKDFAVHVASGGSPATAAYLIVFLFGNPISAVAFAPQFLPQPWGAIGQFLPAGAGASLLRSASFFEGGGSMHPLIVLGSWAVAGLALLMVGRTTATPASPAGPAATPAAESTTAPAGVPASNA